MDIPKFALALLLGLLMVVGLDQACYADATLPPSDDSFVRDKDGQRDLNFDEHADEIKVSAEGFPLGVPVDIGYVRFDVSGVSDTTVYNASLRLYGRFAAPSATQIAVFSTNDDDWNGTDSGLGDEGTLTFANAPTEVVQLDASQSGDGEERWWVFDGPELTAHVAAQLSGNGGDGYVTLRLRAVSQGIVDAQSFHDRENGTALGLAPQLVIHGSPDPTDVDLASLSATVKDDAVAVRWETAVEIETIGYQLYRAGSVDGPRTRLNDTLIPVQNPGSIISARYEYVDDAVVGGQSYAYWLEDVDIHGRSQLHGPVWVTLPQDSRLSPTRPRLYVR